MQKLEWSRRSLTGLPFSSSPPNFGTTHTDTSLENEPLNNGAVRHVVNITAGLYKGKKLVFTQHSPDHYTVYGLSPLVSNGISIERRTDEESVRLHDSGSLYELRQEDHWIAHKFISDSYSGVLAVGTTPQQAFANIFRGRLR